MINERRVYGTLGWNAPYKFSSSDLEVSVGTRRQAVASTRDTSSAKLVRVSTGRSVHLVGRKCTV